MSDVLHMASSMIYVLKCSLPQSGFSMLCQLFRCIQNLAVFLPINTRLSLRTLCKCQDILFLREKPNPDVFCSPKVKAMSEMSFVFLSPLLTPRK